MRKKGLGRGLDALISGEALAHSQHIHEVPAEQVVANPFQPRAETTDEAVHELSESIKAHGILQPLIVRETQAGYELIAGERRWRAAQLAGLKTVPCIVREASDQESFICALVENLQREDLNAMDAAHGYRRLLTEFHLTQSELAEQVGKSRSAIANTLRLLELPPELQQSVRSGELSEGHARALLPLAGDGAKLQAHWNKVRDQRLSVRETEELVRAALETPEGKKAKERVATAGETRDPNIVELEERLQRAIGAKVQVRPRARRGGTIVIRYHSTEELEWIAGLLESKTGGGEVY